MKIALWATMAAVGLALVACGHDNNNTASTSTGNSGSSGSSGSSAPPSTDFVAFVSQQVPQTPGFGTTPAPTTSFSTNLALDTANAFATTSFGSGDALPKGTNQASVSCTQVGTTACNPAVSADLNSTLD
jgi:hypothetical protein